MEPVLLSSLVPLSVERLSRVVVELEARNTGLVRSHVKREGLAEPNRPYLHRSPIYHDHLTVYYFAKVIVGVVDGYLYFNIITDMEFYRFAAQTQGLHRIT